MHPNARECIPRACERERARRAPRANSWPGQPTAHARVGPTGGVDGVPRGALTLRRPRSARYTTARAAWHGVMVASVVACRGGCNSSRKRPRVKSHFDCELSRVRFGYPIQKRSGSDFGNCAIALCSWERRAHDVNDALSGRATLTVVQLSLAAAERSTRAGECALRPRAHLAHTSLLRAERMNQLTLSLRQLT